MILLLFATCFSRFFTTDSSFFATTPSYHEEYALRAPPYAQIFSFFIYDYGQLRAS